MITTNNEYLESIPNALKGNISMNFPNENQNIYNGNFSLKSSTKEFEVSEGKIEFVWLPEPKVTFQGNVNLGFEILTVLFNGEFQIIIKNQPLGKCNVTFSNGEKVTGSISSNIFFGKTNDFINKVTFCIPNLRAFFGDLIKHNNRSFGRRLRLENENYLITIDEVPDFRNLKEQLETIGGYQILYSGEIIPKKGKLAIKELGEIRKICNTFFSFINGRKTSMLFLKGFNNDKLIWEDFTPYKVNSYKSVLSWPQNTPGIYFKDIWRTINEISKDDMGQDFLNSVIHWYTTSNLNLAYVEGSIILSQTALELLYNYSIVETEGLIKGDDSKNITAANKLRMFLTFSKINCSIPNDLIKLNEFVKSDNNFKNNEIEGLINIRNCIVHSQLEKRKKLKKINNEVLVDTSQLFLYYIELGLLRVLDYKGKFINRCTGNEEYVPWVTVP